jgi:hypothetical protein
VRTPRVNLAYSVLKNQAQRDDYLWLIENYTFINMLSTLLSVEKVREPATWRPVIPAHGKKK